MRRNLKNVFLQLSKSNDAVRENNPMMALPIRSGLQDTNETDVTARDAPSLLFHYLFDDWYTTYSLVAKKEHQYGEKLSSLVSEYCPKLTIANVTRARGYVRETGSQAHREASSYWATIERSETVISKLCLNN